MWPSTGIPELSGRAFLRCYHFSAWNPWSRTIQISRMPRSGFIPLLSLNLLAALSTCSCFHVHHTSPSAPPSLTRSRSLPKGCMGTAQLSMARDNRASSQQDTFLLPKIMYSFHCSCGCEPSRDFRDLKRWKQASAVRRMSATDDEKNNDQQGKGQGSRTADEVDQVSATMIGALRGYKKFISPLLPPSCRFLPSCSEYSMQAIREFGPSKGLVLTAWRLMRCNPVHWGSGGRGYDKPTWPPVPYNFHYP